MVIPIPGPEAALLERTGHSIAASGPSLTGRERSEVALLSRAYAAERATPTPGAPREALVWKLTNEAGTIRGDWVDALDVAGISAAEYVEVLGIVSRLAAIDTFCIGLGAPLVHLPEASRLPPTGATARDATIDGAWIPTVGPAWPPSALSLVPSEHQAMHDLHAVFYLSMEGMADMDAERGLHRTQMELVASRTSLLNECFY